MEYKKRAMISISRRMLRMFFKFNNEYNLKTAW